MFLFGQCSPCWLYPFFGCLRSVHEKCREFCCRWPGNHAVHDRFHGQKSSKAVSQLYTPNLPSWRSFETAHAHFDAQIFLGLFTLRDDEVPLGCTASSWIHSMNLWFPRLSHGSHGSLWRMMRLNPPADWYLMILVCSGCVETAKWYWYCSRWDGRSYISPDSGCEIGELYSAVWETNLVLL